MIQEITYATNDYIQEFVCACLPRYMGNKNTAAGSIPALDKCLPFGKVYKLHWFH